jgi:hypothetical protein
MITAAHIRDALNEKPFQPFRLFMSDGSTHDVPHPEFAWVFGSRVFVGLASGAKGGADGRVKQLALLHIPRIQPLARPKARKARH